MERKNTSKKLSYSSYTLAKIKDNIGITPQLTFGSLFSQTSLSCSLPLPDTKN